MCLGVCVCVCERERERERERKGQGIITFEQFYKLKSKSIKEDEKEKFKIIMHFAQKHKLLDIQFVWHNKRARNTLLRSKFSRKLLPYVGLG